MPDVGAALLCQILGSFPRDNMTNLS
ncbi:hypothetical protein A4157S3_90067 [Escherichia coli]|nr:hypothetical protein A4157S3_90067 [Escherichia coli]